MGDIGEPLKRRVLEPFPEEEPVHEPSPGVPAPVTAPPPERVPQEVPA